MRPLKSCNGLPRIPVPPSMARNAAVISSPQWPTFPRRKSISDTDPTSAVKTLKRDGCLISKFAIIGTGSPLHASLVSMLKERRV